MDTSIFFRRLLISFLYAIVLVACGGGSSDSPSPSSSTNKSPTVDVGSDLLVKGQENIVIMASASDTDGSISNYLWEWENGADITLIDSDSDTVNFMTPSVVDGGVNRVFTLKLTVTDNKGATATDSMLITVQPQDNQMPIANAGQDTQALWNEEITITGTASDPDGDVVSIQWTQTEGVPALNLIGTNSSTVTLTAPSEDTNIVLTMTVTDDSHVQSSDTVAITVVRFFDLDNDGVTDDIDVDDDGDRLIEISTLEQLDWVRNNLSGSSLKENANDQEEGDSRGCNSGCIGYELVADLNFDTNDDGVMDDNDDYYNYHNTDLQKGWLPIGSTENPFVAVFNGNNHTIKNLFINRLGTNVGLFGKTGKSSGTDRFATLKNIRFDGELMLIEGGASTENASVGALVGTTHSTTISNCFTDGNVRGDGFGSNIGGLIGFLSRDSHLEKSSAGINSHHYGAGGLSKVGGLVGAASYSEITSSYNLGSVRGKYTGGLLGYANSEVKIKNSYFSGTVIREDEYDEGYYDGGLVGLCKSDSTIEASYWNTNNGMLNTACAITSCQGTLNDVHGVSIEELRCPSSASNIDCVISQPNTVLYKNWDEAVWDFGSDQELPRFSN